MRFWFIYIFFIFTFSIFTMFFNLLCNSTFEQGHLEPWCHRNAFIIIIIIFPQHPVSTCQHFYLTSFSNVNIFKASNVHVYVFLYVCVLMSMLIYSCMYVSVDPLVYLCMSVDTCMPTCQIFYMTCPHTYLSILPRQFINPDVY